MATEHLRELWRRAQRNKRAKERAALGLPPIANRRAPNALKAHRPPREHPWRLDRSAIIERDEPRERLTGEELGREFASFNLDLATD